MSDFWDREIKKCYYQAERKVIRAEEKEKLEERRAAEESKEVDLQGKDEEQALAKELEEEEEFQLIKLKCKRDFGIITQDEFDKIMEEKKKNKL